MEPVTGAEVLDAREVSDTLGAGSGHAHCPRGERFNTVLLRSRKDGGDKRAAAKAPAPRVSRCAAIGSNQGVSAPHMSQMLIKSPQAETLHMREHFHPQPRAETPDHKTS